MSERSYNQYCPIAHALDLVGDRWALLIVRDLLLGPKRFTDLRRGLEGIGTNILTARLKDLEQAGVVTRRYLPPPAASTVYELTAYGAELGASLAALARWGFKTLGAPRADQVVVWDGIMSTVLALFSALGVAGMRGGYAVHLRAGSQEATYGVDIDARGLVTVEREVPPDPAVIVDTDVETVAGLVAGRESLRAAMERGALRLEGDSAQRERLLEAVL
jgi:DNA-binding HxlR family transcriptional regulator